MAHRPFTPRLPRLAGRRPPRRPTLFVALVCPGCSSDAVAVTDRHEHGPAHWRVRMRCGECGSWRETVIARLLFTSLERVIEADLAEMQEAVARLEQARIEDEVSRFSAELDAPAFPA
jgi:hypothetical protein